MGWAIPQFSLIREGLSHSAKLWKKRTRNHDTTFINVMDPKQLKNYVDEAVNSESSESSNENTVFGEYVPN